MLVRKDNKVLTNIVKEAADVPVSVWAHTRKSMPNEFRLIVEF